MREIIILVMLILLISVLVWKIYEDFIIPLKKRRIMEKRLSEISNQILRNALTSLTGEECLLSREEVEELKTESEMLLMKLSFNLF